MLVEVNDAVEDAYLMQGKAMSLGVRTLTKKAVTRLYFNSKAFLAI